MKGLLGLGLVAFAVVACGGPDTAAERRQAAIIEMLNGEPCRTTDTGDDGVIVTSGGEAECVAVDHLQDMLRKAQ